MVICAVLGKKAATDPRTIMSTLTNTVHSVGAAAVVVAIVIIIMAAAVDLAAYHAELTATAIVERYLNP